MKINELTLEYIESQRFRLKYKTYLFYKKINSIYFAKFESKEFDLEVIQHFIADIENEFSTSTAKLVKGILKRSLIFGFERGLINTRFDLSGRIMSKPGRVVSAFSKEEEKKIEKYILENRDNYYYGILISLWTGMRIGEVLALRWEDVDFKKKIISIRHSVGEVSQNGKYEKIYGLPKTKASIREVPIPKILLKLLLKMKNKNVLVLPNKMGGVISTRSYQRAFQSILKKIKINHKGFHSLRHTFATRLLENGTDIKTLSELLGHSNPTVTLTRYVHSNFENKRKAVEFFTKDNTIAILSNKKL